MATVKQLLDEINDGRIRISETVTYQPSPFASDVIWRQTNKYMYEDDTPFSDDQSGLSRELLKELVYAPHLWPEIPVSLIRELEGKLKRTAPGYAPIDGEELLLWIKERLFIPADEAASLFDAMERDCRTAGCSMTLEKIQRTLGGKVAWLHLPGAEQLGLCALEILPRIAASLKVGFSDLALRPLIPRADDQLAAGLNKAMALFEQEAAVEPEELSTDAALLVEGMELFKFTIIENYNRYMDK